MCEVVRGQEMELITFGLKFQVCPFLAVGQVPQGPHKAQKLVVRSPECSGLRATCEAHSQWLSLLLLSSPAFSKRSCKRSA